MPDQVNMAREIASAVVIVRGMVYSADPKQCCHRCPEMFAAADAVRDQECLAAQALIVAGHRQRSPKHLQQWAIDCWLFASLAIPHVQSLARWPVTRELASQCVETEEMPATQAMNQIDPKQLCGLASSYQM